MFNFKESLPKISQTVLKAPIKSQVTTDSLQLTIINQFFPPDYAATGQLIAELANQLKDNFSSVEVFSSQPSYAFECADLPRWEHHQNMNIRRSKSARVSYGRIRGKTFSGAIFFLRVIIHLLRHPSRRQLVLLTTAPPFLPLAGFLLSFFCKISYVCLLYDLYPDIAIELKVVKKQHWLAKLWEFGNHLTWKKSAAIIVLNSTMKQRIVEKIPELVDKVFIIPNWSDPESIKPISREDNWFAREHGLVDRFTVMYSGNMGRCHDLETLLQAMKILRDLPIYFVFVGGGDKRKYMQTSSQELGLTNCLFLPYQSKEDLTYSLTASHVSIVSIAEGMEGLVAPSKLYSALAAASAIAAICPANSYLHDVFARAKCGTTFCNGDSQGLATYLEQLSQNPQLVKELGESGRQYCIENYTREKVAQDYLKLFEFLI